MKTLFKKVRESRKITQAEFAKIMNVAPSTVGLWEQGRREPNYESLNKMADYYGVTTDYLLGREDSSKLPKEESQLLRSFNSLTKEGKAALLTILDSLKMSHSATT